MSFKRCQVVMLPSDRDEKAKVYTIVKRDFDDRLAIVNPLTVADPNLDQAVIQYIYILSPDEPIRRGDYHYDNRTNEVSLAISHLEGDPGFRFKVIATNRKIYGCGKMHLPEMSLGFMNKFVTLYNQGITIEDVMVRYHYQKNEVIVNEHAFDALDPYEILAEHDKLYIDDKDNTISIGKVKNSWSKEEVEKLFRNFRTDVLPFGQVVDAELYKWLDENLA